MGKAIRAIGPVPTLSVFFLSLYVLFSPSLVCLACAFGVLLSPLLCVGAYLGLVFLVVGFAFSLVFVRILVRHGFANLSIRPATLQAVSLFSAGLSEGAAQLPKARPRTCGLI